MRHPVSNVLPTGMVHAGVRQIVLICNVFKTKVRDPRRSTTRPSLQLVEATAANRSGGRDTATPSGRVPACRSCFRRAGAMPWLRTLCKTFASGELVKLRGAQRASQGCGTAACDAPAEPLQWQASFRRVPHGQAGGVRCRRQLPVQLANAKTVETCCKLTVRAATCIGEGGRTHRDGQ